MPVIPPSRLIELQSHAGNVRNVCILAHVDHGKTSMTDSLIATNGIISPKTAGKVRYLDARPDEQARGITMESSAISLYFGMTRTRQQQPDSDHTSIQPDSSENTGSVSSAEAETSSEDYLINLIDSPGHIDFSSEVSTASRLADAAIVLVDAVEGVCSQTVTALRQVWVEKLKPLLIINKIDRLVMELKMSPSEAYAHLERVLEGVNAVIGGFFQGERMEDDLLWRERMEQRKFRKKDDGIIAAEDDDVLDAGVEQQFEDKGDEELYFAPEKNNVIFASAIDGWAFTIRQFAKIYEKRLGIKRALLEKVLWGEYYLDPKSKKVLGSRHLKGRALKPLFVQLVLEPLWTVYDATVGGSRGRVDPGLFEKIIKSLSIKLPTYVLKSRDAKAILQGVFSVWLPLSTAVLVSIVEYLPSPPSAQASRLAHMLDRSPGAQAISESVRRAIVDLKQGGDAPMVAYVSKMVAIPESELPGKKKKPRSTTLSAVEARELARTKRAEFAKAHANGMEIGNTPSTVTNDMSSMDICNGANGLLSEAHLDDPEHLIGFARLYAGSLSVGDEVYVLPPKFSPINPEALRLQRVTIKALYLLMGRALERLESVPAGVVFGIEGLEGHILKNGSLCSQLEGAPNLAGANVSSKPIVRVALEPIHPADLSKMAHGLRLLEKSDPCAMYEQLESGEHVISTAGELHLERCLKDLRERFAKCEIQAGEPIVPYRESITKGEEMEPPKDNALPRGTTMMATASNQISVRIRVQPLPTAVTDFLIDNIASIRKLYSEKQAAEQRRKVEQFDLVAQEDRGAITDIDDTSTDANGLMSLSQFCEKLENCFEQLAEADSDIWKNVVKNISAFGPKRIGPNLFIDATESRICSKFFDETSDAEASTNLTQQVDLQRNEGSGDTKLTVSGFSDTVVHAFQLATHQGPLCREPMQGVAVFLESILVHSSGSSSAIIAKPLSSHNEVEDNPFHQVQDQMQQKTPSENARLTGELITLVRNAIAAGFLDWPSRILLAMYNCTIQATPEVLGRVYNVLSRRRGSILSETLLEGTPYFTITSTLPVAESFGFSDEIRKRTSGLAQPILLFAGFRVLHDVDPNWIPTSEVELEDLGEFADRENIAKKYVDAVRRRKGLLVKGSRGIGRDAEKQRNLKTN